MNSEAILEPKFNGTLNRRVILLMACCDSEHYGLA